MVERQPKDKLLGGVNNFVPEDNWGDFMAITEKCKVCGEEISIRKMPNGKWVPFDVITNKPHSCHANTESKSKNSIVQILKNQDISIHADKRKNGGCLWILGGKEIEIKMKQVEQSGYKFKYTPNGGEATQFKPSWYFSDKQNPKKGAHKSITSGNLVQTSYINFDSERTILPLLRAAISENDNVMINYYTTSKDRWTNREITPYKVYSNSDGIYLEAFCHLSQEKRTFRIDKIKSAEIIIQKKIIQSETTKSLTPSTELAEQNLPHQSVGSSVNWSWIISGFFILGLIYLAIK